MVDVLPLDIPELRADQPFHGVDEHQRHHEHGDCQSDADNRGAGAERVADDVADDHASGRPETAGGPRPIQCGQTVARRRLRLHRLGGRQPDRAATAPKAPAAAVNSVMAVAHQDHAHRHREQQFGKSEELVVQAADLLPSQAPASRPSPTPPAATSSAHFM